MFLGYFVEGMPHGQGVLQFATGERLACWVTADRTKTAARYEGQFVAGQQCGQGTWTHPEGVQSCRVFNH